MHDLFFGISNVFLDKYNMAIYLSLGKYEILLFPHPCKGIAHYQLYHMTSSVQGMFIELWHWGSNE